jgi:DNA (cytosine-5)-methyltransferase 1
VKLRVLDLFSGIGAYALGVERAGMKVVAFCESEDFPRRVLRKHWPDVPIYDDVRTLNADALRHDGIAVDVIIGGWPCQDISPAGTRAGLDGARSGLWSEIARLAGELRPRFLILENSASLLNSPPEQPGRDFGRVLGDLAALGYDAEWHCLPAAAFDAPHIRDRLWIVGTLANAACVRREDDGDAGADRARRKAKARAPARGAVVANDRGGNAFVSDADSTRSHAGAQARIHRSEEGSGPRHEQSQRSRSDVVANANSLAPIGSAIARQERHTWDAEPDVDRVAARSPVAVDRIKSLGNCNPPIIPETIARAILASLDKAA